MQRLVPKLCLDLYSSDAQESRGNAEMGNYDSFFQVFAAFFVSFRRHHSVFFPHTTNYYALIKNDQDLDYAYL
jgi:hypothetical protein